MIGTPTEVRKKKGNGLAQQTLIFSQMAQEKDTTKDPLFFKLWSKMLNRVRIYTIFKPESSCGCGGWQKRGRMQRKLD